MNPLGRIGAWVGLLGGEPASVVREAAGELDAMGYEAIWHGEAVGREAFAFGALLLSATTNATIASGIANIWARDATAMHNGARTLAEAWDDRYVLGMGVSHQPIVDIRGHHYDRPWSAMRTYLDAFASAPYRGPGAGTDVPVILSALGPKMLRLAAERTLGSHPYFVPVEHTSFAREVMGPGPLLAPEQAVVVSDDPAEARAAARHHMKLYLALPNYRRNLLRLGWSADELDANPDPLVDAIVAWGTLDEIGARVADHFERGADHVAIQVLPAGSKAFPLEGYRALAPVLKEVAGA